MLRWLCLLALIFGLLAERVSAIENHTMVLATSSASALPPITIQEARKLFMGVPFEKGGEHPVPLLNTSNALTYEVFLQKVAFMSASAFETQTISIVFRLGGKRPEIFKDVKDLVKALQENPGAVTFLWEDQVRANQGIKSVNILWQGSTE
jgi:hypothetical protein